MKGGTQLVLVVADPAAAPGTWMRFRPVRRHRLLRLHSALCTVEVKGSTALRSTMYLQGLVSP